MEDIRKLTIGSLIGHREFKNREKVSQWNDHLDRLEVCPTKAITVYNDKTFGDVTSPGKEVDKFASEDKFRITKIFAKDEFLIARRLPEEKERIKVSFDQFPQVKVFE